MKSKLIKTEKGYHLDTGSFDGIHLACYPHDVTKQRLSLKNCQTIERGYDLDELAEEFCKEYDTLPVVRYNTFKAGFETALDLMGDKKFSEKDIKKVIFLCCNDADSTAETIFESLQQTEWDVEIETVPALSNNGNVYYGDIPKLDADGCLILKRI